MVVMPLGPTPSSHVCLTSSLGASFECDYIVFVCEKSENATNHRQGYVLFKTARTFSTVAALLPCCQHEIQRSCSDQATFEYFEKDGESVEQGTFVPTAIDVQEMRGARR